MGVTKFPEFAPMGRERRIREYSFALVRYISESCSLVRLRAAFTRAFYRGQLGEREYEGENKMTIP